MHGLQIICKISTNNLINYTSIIYAKKNVKNYQKHSLMFKNKSKAGFNTLLEIEWWREIRSRYSNLINKITPGMIAIIHVLKRCVLSQCSNSTNFRGDCNDYIEIEYNIITCYGEYKQNSTVFVEISFTFRNEGKQQRSNDRNKDMAETRKIEGRNRIELFHWCINRSRCNGVPSGPGGRGAMAVLRELWIRF